MIPLRSVGHVGGKTFCGGQTWTFAYEKDSDLWRKQRPDLVQYSDSAVTDHEGLSYGPVALYCLLIQEL